ncbi:MAG: hypothetical protein ACKVT2_22940 [Saprospiraceae bacterium]
MALQKKQSNEPTSLEMSNTEDYSFPARADLCSSENEVKYYFDLNEKGKPVKLGDGSFGSVYKVRNQQNLGFPGLHAVKVFYPFTHFIWLDRFRAETDESADDQKANIPMMIMEEQFKNELEVMVNIRKAVTNKGVLNPVLAGLMEPRHGSKSFHESDAAKKLFTGMLKGVSSSVFAIVYDCYDGTLKDLLESKNSESEYTAYEALRKVSPNTRIKWILPILSPIIDGLRTLNYGGFAHLDLKPANIFYKKKNENAFEIVIGDVGFLDPGESLNNKTQVAAQDESSRRRLLGSLHFRSPEQKDSYDICDGEVFKQDGKVLSIKIIDPKFKHSIVEPGDFVSFDKLLKNTRFIITKIDAFPNVEEPQFWTLTIEDKEQEVNVDDGERTQIVLRKKQGTRTDLYGVGAIAFDLLTGGQSSERFYERIRILDNKETPIKEIMNRYERVENFNSNDPISQHIFNVFRYKEQYPDRRMVEFILKCMLYNSPGNYYEDLKGRGEFLFHELKTEFTTRFSKFEMATLNNPIVFRKDFITDDGGVEPKKLATILSQIQNLSEDHFGHRLVLGYLYLKEIIKYVEDQMFETKEAYFLEFYPSNVTKSDEGRHTLKCENITFREEEEYFEALLAGDIQLKLYTDQDDFFVPDYITHLRKPIELEAVISNKNSAGALNDTFPVDVENEGSVSPNQEYLLSFHYSFQSKSYSYDTVKAGDWIVAYHNDEPVELYRIEFADRKQRMLLKLIKKAYSIEDRVSTPIPEKVAIKYIYFKDINRLAYYLHMLGMYVHQFFFFKKGGSNSEVLSFVDQINIDIFRHPDTANYSILPSAGNVQKRQEMKSTSPATSKGEKLSLLLAALSRLYARFTFHQGVENSFYRDPSPLLTEWESKNERDQIFSEISVEMTNLRIQIEELLDFHPGKLDRLLKIPLPDELKKVFEIEDVNAKIAKNPDFVAILEQTIFKR